MEGMTTKNQARAVADVDKGMVLASVEIAAPPERVFKALTTADGVLRWWGGEGAYKTTEWDGYLQPGGKWRTRGATPDGNVFQVQGEYFEVDPPHKLILTWRPDWDAPNETLVTYILEPSETGTLLTLRREGFGEHTVVCRNHGDGWTRVLGWLEADLRPPADLPPTAAPSKCFLYRLLPPRATFPFDATPEELNAMRAHGVYWRGKIAEGKAIVLGPVTHPAGAWGVGILCAADLAEAEALCAADPVILENRGFRCEVFPMMNAIHA
jgi:uncharacterized protein YndB with AHSA1/START domain